MPVRPAIRPAPGWSDVAIHKPSPIDSRLVTAAPLHPTRAKRITGMDSVRAPFRRFSVSCRFLRNLRSPPAFRRVSHEMERRSRGH